MKGRRHRHIACLVKVDDLVTDEGDSVEVFELRVGALKQQRLKEWAKHFREHYMLDDIIDSMMEGTPHSTRKDYLLSAVFPTLGGWGPATRSGDFTEILISDFVESTLDFWVPRTRYRLKQIPNESPKGSDIVGLKFVPGSPKKHSPKDVLLTFEVKGLMQPDKKARRLQDAINDAKKDSHDDAKKGDAKGAFRVGLTLNALKHRYIDSQDEDAWKAVQRFQDPISRPFVHQIGASAVFCNSAYDESTITSVTTKAYATGAKPKLMIVKGDELMKVIHTMYEMAANEA